MNSTGIERNPPATVIETLDPVSLRAGVPARAAIDACDALARAGKLPGFHRLTPESGAARVFGQPFDRDLLVDAVDAPGGSVISLRTTLRARTPVTFAVVALLTVWPGVWLTDSLIQTYFPGASGWKVQTWMWYLPLAVLPLPFAARSMWRKSQRSAAEHFAEVCQRVSLAVGASPTPRARPVGGHGPHADATPRETLSASA